MADINMCGVTKASGHGRLSEALRHRPEPFDGVRRRRQRRGDDPPCGCRRGVGNAVDAAKRAADYVTATVDDDGVLRALQHYEVL